MKPIPTAWLMSKMDLPDNCNAGVAPTIAPADIQDGWQLTPEDRAHVAGDPCPRCKKPMQYDAGQDMDRSHPGQQEAVFCADCGDEYAVQRLTLEASIAEARRLGLRVSFGAEEVSEAGGFGAAYAEHGDNASAALIALVELAGQR